MTSGFCQLCLKPRQICECFTISPATTTNTNTNTPTPDNKMSEDFIKNTLRKYLKRKISFQRFCEIMNNKNL